MKYVLVSMLDGLVTVYEKKEDMLKDKEEGDKVYTLEDDWKATVTLKDIDGKVYIADIIE